MFWKYIKKLSWLHHAFSNPDTAIKTNLMTTTASGLKNSFPPIISFEHNHSLLLIYFMDIVNKELSYGLPILSFAYIIWFLHDILLG